MSRLRRSTAPAHGCPSDSPQSLNHTVRRGMGRKDEHPKRGGLCHQRKRRFQRPEGRLAGDRCGRQSQNRQNRPAAWRPRQPGPHQSRASQESLDGQDKQRYRVVQPTRLLKVNLFARLDGPQCRSLANHPQK
jgi:hypothetical protein